MNELLEAFMAKLERNIVLFTVKGIMQSWLIIITIVNYFL